MNEFKYKLKFLGLQFRRALNVIYGRLTFQRHLFEQMQQVQIFRFLKKNLSVNYPVNNNEKEIDSVKVFIFWYQGVKLAPPVTQFCLKSMKKNLKNCELIFIDKNNLSNYVDLPYFILDKVEKNIISLTHFSDILRVNLLAQHGGFWLDSTIFVAHETNVKELLKKNNGFYTQKMIYSPLSPHISRSMWTGYLMGTNTMNHSFFVYLSELLNCYWKKFNTLADYFLIDYMIMLAYTNNEQISDMINNININSSSFNITKKLNLPFVEKQIELLTDNFYKLTNKIEFNTTYNGDLTLFGYLQNYFNEIKK